MSKKLQNIKAVKEMIAGTHKFQTKKTIGSTEIKKNKIKKEEELRQVDHEVATCVSGSRLHWG